MKYSIVIPCYNEEKNILELVKRFSHIQRGYNIELVLVDNGSSDETRKEIDLWAAQYNFITPCYVDVNQGYGYGILSGLAKASGECLGWMHADLQSDPSVFCAMMDSAMREKGNFLYKGSRKERPVLDTLFTIGMSFFETVLLHKGLWDINAQPTLLSREFYSMWKEPPYDFSLDLYVYYLAKLLKIKVSRFESVQHNRMHGKSTWNTGLKSRINMSRRVINYSKNVKKIIKNSYR